MPATISLGIIEAKKFSVFIDIFPITWFVLIVLSTVVKFRTLRVPLKEWQMLALLTLLERGAGSKLQKCLAHKMTMS